MKFLILFIITIVSVSCASQKESQSKINSLEVSEKLAKGLTTQAQVLETFGAPDIVEKTPDGDMWGYNRISSESESVGASASHFISSAALWNWTGVGVSGDKGSSSTKTASLTLYFNKSRVLKHYSFRTERF